MVGGEVEKGRKMLSFYGLTKAYMAAKNLSRLSFDSYGGSRRFESCRARIFNKLAGITQFISIGYTNPIIS